MIEASHLLRFVVRPTLRALRDATGLSLDGPAAETLLLATAAQETHGGRYLHQLGKGPARGIYQMEPATYVWTLAEVRRRSPTLSAVINELRPALVATTLEGSLHYATACARARYWLVPLALPSPADPEAVWAYYKRWWNSERGAAQREEFLANWERYGTVNEDMLA